MTKSETSPTQPIATMMNSTLLDDRHINGGQITNARLNNEAMEKELNEVSLVFNGKESKSNPLRKSLVTHVIAAKGEMFRFVLDPKGQLVFDIDQKLPGRGLYLEPDRTLFATAVKKSLFSKAAKTKVTLQPDLETEIEKLLLIKIQSLLGLAKRAGQIVFGYDQVADHIKHRRPIGLLLQASDAATAGRDKLSNMAKSHEVISAGGEQTHRLGREFTLLTSEELALPFSRERLVHLIVAKGQLCDKLCHTLQKLQNWRK